MRLQLNFKKDCTREFSKNEILDMALKMQTSGLLSSQCHDIAPMDENTYSELLDALNALQGISASRQTLSYMPGLGGMFGHGIEVNFDYKHLMPVLWAGTDKDDGYTLNTVLFLEQFSQCKMTNELLAENDLDDVIKYLETINENLDYSGDNTYNYSSDFSQDMNFYSPSISSFEEFETCIVFVSLHYGGDARCNYGRYTAYSMSYDDYTTFLGMHFGFYNENEEYHHLSTGYSQDAQHDFFKEFEIVERIDNQKIKAKNIETGEIVEFYTDIRI